MQILVNRIATGEHDAGDQHLVANFQRADFVLGKGKREIRHNNSELCHYSRNCAQFGKAKNHFNNASACFRAASLWPPSIRASWVTRDFLSSNVISEIVRPFFTCLLTT